MFALSLLADPYPQRRDWREIAWLDRMAERLRVTLLSRWKTTPRRLNRFVDQVDRAERALANLPKAATFCCPATWRKWIPARESR